MFDLHKRSRRLLASWTWEQLADFDFTAIYNPFSHGAAFNTFFKRKGHQVLTSDILQSNYWLNKALIENPALTLTDDLVTRLNTVNQEARIFGAWSGQYFTEEEVRWLSGWWLNLADPKSFNDDEKALGYSAVYLVMQYWLSFNRYHLQNQKPMTPDEAMRYYAERLNHWIYDNHMPNMAYFTDAYEMVSNLPTDVLYIYPPSPQGFRQYDLRVYLWECWTQQTTELNLESVFSKDSLRLGQCLSDSMEQYWQALEVFLQSATGNRIWAVAYNDQIPRAKDRLTELIQGFRPITKEAEMIIPYPTAGGKTVSREGLLVSVA